MENLKTIFLFFLITGNVIAGSIQMEKNNIINLLSGKRYSHLFLTSSDEIISTVWNHGKNYNTLLSIIKSETTPLTVKFLSAEIIGFYKKEIPEEYNEILAQSYSYALERTSMMDMDKWIGISANSWGFLFEMKSSGPLGKKLIGYGDCSVKYLIPLLDNHGKVLFEGSKEATIGNGYGYEICDFASYYISRITGIPLTYTRDRKKQNLKTERLKIEVMDKTSFVERIEIDHFKNLNKEEPDKTYNLKDRDKIDEITGMILKLPEKGDIYKKLSSSSTLYVIKYIINSASVHELRIYNDRVQMPDTAFLSNTNKEEDSLVKAIKKLF